MMKARLEARLNRTWYGTQPPGFMLGILERVYERLSRGRAGVLAKSRATDLEGRPIIVVGNITVGGTGKTPLVIRLCQLLQAAGLNPGVVSRGYGRREQGLVCLEGNEPVEVSGDEPRLIADRTGVMVAVGKDRPAAARLLFGRGIDVVISDDGLQRADLPRNYEICVIDGSRGLGNGRLLPAGPLRERAERLETVDTVVVSEPSEKLGLPVDTVAMSLAVDNPVRLRDGSVAPLESWRLQSVERKTLAVAGIGNPGRFFDTLERLGIEFEPRAFPDHHLYTAADFDGALDRRIVMTEKDAVKCRELPLADAWFLPVSASLPDAWERDFVTAACSFVADSRMK